MAVFEWHPPLKLPPPVVSLQQQSFRCPLQRVLWLLLLLWLRWRLLLRWLLPPAPLLLLLLLLLLLRLLLLLWLLRRLCGHSFVRSLNGRVYCTFAALALEGSDYA